MNEKKNKNYNKTASVKTAAADKQIQLKIWTNLDRTTQTKDNEDM